jgi:hypothetical protein
MEFPIIVLLEGEFSRSIPYTLFVSTRLFPIVLYEEPDKYTPVKPFLFVTFPITVLRFDEETKEMP